MLLSRVTISQTLLPSVVASASATEAEILWTVSTAVVLNSDCSCDGLPKLFHCMFPDSAIAKYFTVGQSKCGYYLSFSVAPYLKNSHLS